MWSYLFALPRQGIWSRTWHAAGLLIVVSIAILWSTGRLADVVGPLDPARALLGAGTAAVTVVATHVAHRLACRWWPSVAAQVDDLYDLRVEDGRWLVAPVALMGLGEELLFRGVVQDRAGLVVAVLAYASVQLPARKWTLVLAAAVDGVIWGTLFAWTGGLLAPVIAHVAWTTTLTFVWPLQPADDRTPLGATA